MLCTRCGQRQANVFFSQSINGRTEEHSLCEECAKEMGLFDKGAGFFDFGEIFSPVQFLSSLLGESHAPEFKSSTYVSRCPTCGMTYPKFTKQGRFGCADCYDAFGDMLPPIFTRLHGSSKHTGKMPGRGGKEMGKRRQLEDLRRQLKAAVDAEEYEKAAKLRDRIRQLESEI